MGENGRLCFYERVLRGGVDGRFFWENIDDEKRRIYCVEGCIEYPDKKSGRLKFLCFYLDNQKKMAKTLDRAAFDLEVKKRELSKI